MKNITSAKKVTSGKETVDNFDKLLKQMETVNIGEHVSLTKLNSTLGVKNGYFDKVKSGSGAIFSPLSSVGKWWSKLVKEGKNYDKALQNIKDSDKKKSITSEYTLKITNALELPEISRNKLSSLISKEYKNSRNRLSKIVENITIKLKQTLIFNNTSEPNLIRKCLKHTSYLTEKTKT